MILPSSKEMMNSSLLVNFPLCTKAISAQETYQTSFQSSHTGELWTNMFLEPPPPL